MNLAYWYQPKGLAVTSNALLERLIVLKPFANTLPWRDCQSEYIECLRAAKISNAEAEWQEGGAPLARMLKQVMAVTGLAWVNDTDLVDLTVAGEALLASKDKDEILANQVLRYQFWNPTIKSRSHTAIRLHPIPFLIRLLQAVTHIDTTEYNLFVSRASRIDEVDTVAELIDQYRALSVEEKYELVRQCENYKLAGAKRSSIYNTIQLNRPYAYRMFMLSQLFEFDSKQHLSLKSGVYRGKIRAYMESYIKDGVYIDFVSPKEFIAYFGDPEQRPTKDTALNVYVERNDILSAQAIKKDMGTPKAELQKFRQMMISEKTLEDNIEADFTAFSKRVGRPMILIGRQYQTNVGPIDLLAQDKSSGEYIVIELKKGRSADRVFGQLSRYMGWVKKNLSAGGSVSGIIVAAQIDAKLRAARDAHSTDVVFVEYQSKVSVSVV